jgi:hypothetical protein
LGSGNWVELDARLSHGIGSSDMNLYVPDAVFAGGTYVYLYSKFGVNVGCNGGFEQWATGESLVTPTGTISGTVFNASANNAPYAGATVTLGQLSTTTNASGNYSFSNLAVGSGPFANFTKYTVAAVAPSGFTVTPPQTVVLTTPAVTGLNFYLTAVQTFSISGFVTDNGSPNTAYTVTLTDTTTHVTRTFTASASSAYSFSNLTARDNYTVTVSSPGNMDTPTSYIINNLMNNLTNENFLITARTT